MQLSLRSRDNVLQRCSAHHLSLYNLSELFRQTGSPLKLADDLAGPCSPLTGSRESSDWTGQIQDGVVISDVGDFPPSFFFFFMRKSQHILDSLPGTIVRESSNPQTTLSFLYSFCLWFFSRNPSSRALQ